MKPGSIVKKLVAPFVKGTKYQDCEKCREREKSINNWWTRLMNYVIGLIGK